MTVSTWVRAAYVAIETEQAVLAAVMPRRCTADEAVAAMDHARRCAWLVAWQVLHFAELPVPPAAMAESHAAFVSRTTRCVYEAAPAFVAQLATTDSETTTPYVERVEDALRNAATAYLASVEVAGQP